MSSSCDFGHISQCKSVLLDSSCICALCCLALFTQAEARRAQAATAAATAAVKTKNKHQEQLERAQVNQSIRSVQHQSNQQSSRASNIAFWSDLDSERRCCNCGLSNVQRVPADQRRTRACAYVLLLRAFPSLYCDAAVTCAMIACADLLYASSAYRS